MQHESCEQGEYLIDGLSCLIRILRFNTYIWVSGQRPYGRGVSICRQIGRGSELHIIYHVSKPVQNSYE